MYHKWGILDELRKLTRPDTEGKVGCVGRWVLAGRDAGTRCFDSLLGAKSKHTARQAFRTQVRKQVELVPEASLIAGLPSALRKKSRDAGAFEQLPFSTAVVASTTQRQGASELDLTHVGGEESGCTANAPTAAVAPCSRPSASCLEARD